LACRITAVRLAVTQDGVGSNPTVPAKIMNKLDLLKKLAEINNMERIAVDLEPGSMKMALLKQIALEKSKFHPADIYKAE
jgi:hypothetical protein